MPSKVDRFYEIIINTINRYSSKEHPLFFFFFSFPSEFVPSFHFLSTRTGKAVSKMMYQLCVHELQEHS